MTGYKPLGTPLAQKHNLHMVDGPVVDATNYHSLVGALQYLTLTRPDLRHVVSMILSYSSLNLYGFSDANWVGCPNTRRSTTGYYIYSGANCISWASKKQATVSRSSAKEEYRSMATISTEITWISYILRETGLGMSSPPASTFL
ncbi:uncharacterized mitochondrial protein AtMg00810-like [Cornus florida]|uniref:uncharacterized mitochondrial protein AtMg00810-like n=1 Tax=Cornus florida TaxID=4283 RepID=UPI0028A18636|nr:uncharacterized mitochondrial protein AtMg00810-like [Cornus florida]